MSPYSRIRYDPAKFEPFAQVTVFDAHHGDANIIDIKDEDVDTWRRVLIDTGPHDANEEILNAILDALEKVALPKMKDSTDDPVVPPLDEFQVTHVDADHIGNAHHLASRLRPSFDRWLAANPRYRCLFVFPHVPPSAPDFKLDGGASDTPVLTTALGVIRNQIVFRLSSSMMECARDIKLFGLEARFTLRLPHEPRDHPGLMHGVQTIKSEAGSWDSIECTYTKVDYDLKHLIDLRVTLKIYDIDRPSGGEHMVLEYQYKSMFVKLPNWLDPPRVPCSGQPKPSQALPLPRVYPNRLLTDTPIYRKNDQRGAGYLAKLGHEVGVLTAAGLALTRNGIRSLTIAGNPTLIFPANPSATETYASPHVDTYRDLGRYILHSSDKYDGTHLEMDNKITNQASVVTMFHRKNLKLRMLFTGDAYDLHCNIMRTIMAFDVGTDLSIKVDVLKIPHHGSEVTVHASFYQIVRAEVYIVCAAHNNPHVNPRFSTLKAIVRGFSTQAPRANEQPFKILFSYPDILDGTTSAAAEIIKHPLLGPKFDSRTNKWDYEMWHVKSATHNIGRVLFGAKRQQNLFYPYAGLDELLHPEDWAICHKWDAANNMADVIKL